MVFIFVRVFGIVRCILSKNSVDNVGLIIVCLIRFIVYGLRKCKWMIFFGRSSSDWRSLSIGVFFFYVLILLFKED